MDYKISKMATHLVFVAQGHGADMFDEEAFDKEYRFIPPYKIGNLWGLANNSMKQGFFKFEYERDFIAKHLPAAVEPKSFWKRNFTNWRNE